ncbi:DUF4398 domain-containing protein [Stigmatella aurantiaca]|uniref:Conserved uncharacterized protein n=1 Tax=Stigmatella aurantiaca (strain DW4/3-1) TaxID=378806 RepID=Q091E6_STIAD|nr:DUF4398 domain-containing protein [Stigmatella aurantiaca]ADO73704.1 conserved uncharacterized protein [Stigmatella aurantiaca DW4/3-1]EAU66377.1 hypothetical protein STIAU_1080 [Stigmatella aurantiaca DW4/3-1]
MKQLTVLVAVAGALAGCGPVRTTANLLDAEVQIQAARTAGAEKEAPYEWTLANLYLYKAREEVGYSDYQAGVDFAVKASKYANEAREKAMSVGSESSPSGSRPTP